MNPGTKGDETMKVCMTRRISGAMALVLMMVLPAVAGAQQNDYAITGGTDSGPLNRSLTICVYRS